jgi:hypothetical protein
MNQSLINVNQVPPELNRVFSNYTRAAFQAARRLAHQQNREK